MKEIDLYIAGSGIVSAAGWGSSALLAAIEGQQELPTEDLGEKKWKVRSVPKWQERPQWVRQPRLRRSSPITKYAVAACLEALGIENGDAAPKVAVIAVIMNGAVQYSARFYQEVLDNPASASPILFPETVFNAPGSHVAALLGASGPSATLVGDGSAQTLGAFELARQWLAEDSDLEGVVVVAAEEIDEVSVAGACLLDPQRICSEGSAALLLTREPKGAKLEVCEEAISFDLQELIQEIGAWRFPENVDLENGFCVVNGGKNLPRERALAEKITFSACYPQQFLGELFGVSSLMGFALAAEKLVECPASKAAWVADCGAWNSGFLAKLSV